MQNKCKRNAKTNIKITLDMYDAFSFTESIPPRYLEFELELKIKNLNFSVKILYGNYCS